MPKNTMDWIVFVYLFVPSVVLVLGMVGTFVLALLDPFMGLLNGPKSHR